MSNPNDAVKQIKRATLCSNKLICFMLATQNIRIGAFSRVKKREKKGLPKELQVLIFIVVTTIMGRGGFEPPTLGFSGRLFIYNPSTYNELKCVFCVKMRLTSE